jgi:MoxR-like ATPase
MDPMSTQAIQADRLQAFRADFAKLCEEIGRVVVGQRAAIEGAVMALLAGGHALVEGPPGVGKTLLARTLADATELTFRRIQFTPDVMGADVIGTYVVMESAGRRKFEFQQGPVFANIVLADEINRATPKTQSALLEALQEFGVTVANETYDLPQPFFVIATQGPDEGDGTFPLPEKQLDRFLARLDMQRPAAAEMESIIDRASGVEEPAARPVLTATRIVEMTQLVRQIGLDPKARNYAVRLAAATQPDNPTAPPLVKKYVRQGASPRGALALVLLAKAHAAAAGRDRATADDVKSQAGAALAHRLAINFEGHAERVSADVMVGELLQQVAP